MCPGDSLAIGFARSRVPTMSSLIVKIPCRDPGHADFARQLQSLLFVLCEEAGTVISSGRVALDALPRAKETVLLLAAPDVLLLSAKLPPLHGRRLRQALPHMLEEQLLREVQHCHIALDPAPAPSAGADVLHTLAVTDRAWLRFLLETFALAGHRRLKVLPVARCLPPDTSDSPAVSSRRLVLFPGAGVCDGALADESAVELLAIDAGQPLLGAGWRVPLSELPATLAALAPASATPGAGVQHVVLPSVRDTSVESAASQGGMTGGSVRENVKENVKERAEIAFADVARQALSCDFDLCQFEFSRRAWPGGMHFLKRCRRPLLLLAATLVLNLVGINLRWACLQHQRNMLMQQQVLLLRQTFPQTTVVLDAPSQMTHLLEARRGEAGEPIAGSLIALCDALSRALGPIAVQSIHALDYRDAQLFVAFNAATSIDPGFAERLKAAGVHGEPLPSDAGDAAIRAHGGVTTPAGGEIAPDAEPVTDPQNSALPEWVLRSQP